YGGSYQGGTGQSAVDTVRTLLQRNGRAFRLVVPGRQLDFPASLPLDSTGAATFRSAQRHQGIVVDGGNMLVPVDRVPDRPEISIVRGRIFSGINVASSAGVSESDARAIASGVVGGTVTSPFSLLVYTSTTQ